MEYKAVEAAAERIRGHALRTPVMTSRTLDEVTGNSLFLKCENFQRGGAFKFRGAFNTMSQLNASERKAGVLTFSSGNHAQATALSGKLLGVHVVVVMPDDAPAVKKAATEGYGGEVILYHPSETKREDLASRLVAEHGYSLIPPFNHPEVIAGQGTAAMELLDEVEGLDVVLTPCGGGGLLSGSAITVKHRLPDAQVIGVEPEGADNGNRAFRSGTIESVEHPNTMADGLKPHALGNHTFAVISRLVDEMVTVSEEEIRSTLQFLWTRMKLVVEPSGAVGLAPIFHRKLKLKGKRIGVILSGGNADVGAVSDWFRAPEA